ncbi:ribonuclease HII [uncultured Tessaracoccus sp.]|uniref:ribonuclease HII n=1 Tax=uncultured Tessaracoccus sp. TaxID=905023 RepID=UPI0025F337AB|nr:ribonuclease HII [uncultured Tessaracoccus sp.]
MTTPHEGSWAFERALVEAGLGPVAGADEAGRGASAGPLVAAAVILDPDDPIAGLDDSKRLTPRRREALHDEILARALAVAVSEVGPAECDALGMHEADIQGLRRAIGKLTVRPGFVLTDGFPVDGVGTPGLAMWKGDKVAACVSAASIVAKVTRDRIMVALAEEHPGYGFEVHKGYNTAAHQASLRRCGPSPVHRWCFSNVRAAADARGGER